MFLKPEKGRSVPDPAHGDLLPKNGRNVEPSAYWYRRIAEKDVTEPNPPEQKDGNNGRKLQHNSR